MELYQSLFVGLFWILIVKILWILIVGLFLILIVERLLILILELFWIFIVELFWVLIVKLFLILIVKSILSLLIVKPILKHFVTGLNYKVTFLILKIQKAFTLEKLYTRKILLNRFHETILFYNHWKHEKSKFSKGVEKYHWH